MMNTDTFRLINCIVQIFLKSSVCVFFSFAYFSESFDANTIDDVNC